MATKSFTIKSLSKHSGLSEFYIRKCIREGSLNSTLENLNAKTQRHRISETDYKSWRAKTSARTQRADGRNKYVFYATPAEFKVFLANSKEKSPAVAKTIARANPPKAKKSNS
jgi:hypothetical protein